MRSALLVLALIAATPAHADDPFSRSCSPIASAAEAAEAFRKDGLSQAEATARIASSNTDKAVNVESIVSAVYQATPSTPSETKSRVQQRCEVTLRWDTTKSTCSLMPTSESVARCTAGAEVSKREELEKIK